jgi:hypothetical protein
MAITPWHIMSNPIRWYDVNISRHLEKYSLLVGRHKSTCEMIPRFRREKCQPIDRVIDEAAIACVVALVILREILITPALQLRLVALHKSQPWVADIELGFQQLSRPAVPTYVLPSICWAATAAIRFTRRAVLERCFASSRRRF